MNWKKKFLIVGIFLAVLGLPVFMVSSPMMDTYQGCINSNPETSFNKWLQLRIGGISYHTGRAERSADAYLKFVRRYPGDERREFALIHYGKALEDAKKYDEAIDAYDWFLAEYPNHEYTEDARNGIRRIKYIIPH